MTVRVHLLSSVLAVEQRRTVTVPAGTTAAEVLAQHRHPQWHEVGPELRVCLNGRFLDAGELGEPLPAGADLVLCPVAAGVEAIALFLFQTILLAGISYGLAMISAPPDRELPQERGDSASPVYAWDRVHTEYRAGFPVPIIYGEVDTGGQVIYSDVRPYSGNEYLRVVLALCEGRIESVGGVTGGALGEVDQLGGFAGGGSGGTIPTDLRVNGNRLDHANSLPGAQVWFRAGEVKQTALPDPFLGTRTTLAVNGGDLNDLNSEVLASFSVTEPVTTATLVLAFPSGVYQQASGGQLSQYRVDVDVYWRVDGGGWNVVGSFQLSGTGILFRLSYWVRTIEFNFGASPTGTIEIKVVRRTAQGGSGVVSGLQLRQVIYGASTVFRYPGVALIGLNVLATEQRVTGRSEFVARVRGRRVRVWDSALGLSSANMSATQGGRYWLVPPSGDPYFGIWTYPPGQNPAWILADFLTFARGGVGLDDSEIDWAVFRDWADFCDQSVSVGGPVEAFLKFDVVLDQPRTAWDIILDICRAGRAVPVRKGNLISVVYFYRDAHGRGSNSVPAIAPTQLFHAGNLRDFEIAYQDTMRRPAVLVGQFTNADKDHAQDTVDVEDPEGGFNRPDTSTPLDFVKETIQMFGITRSSQVRRELLYRHAQAREIRSRCTFGVGIEALAATVGDLVDVQDDALRPYDVESFGMRVYEAGTGVSSIKLTHDVTLAVGKTYQVRVRARDESVVSRTITSASGTYVAGTALTFSGGTINIDKGAPVVFGELNKLVKTFQIVALSLNEDLTRQVTAIEWAPSVHDIPDVGSLLPEEDNTFWTSPYQLDVTDTGATAPEEHVEGLAVVLARSGHVLSWVRPKHRQAAPARVYARGVDGEWQAVGETKGSSLAVEAAPGESVTYAVTLADPAGIFQAPTEVPTVTAVGDEFPAGVDVPQVRNASLVVAGGNQELAVEWDAIAGAGVDRYEVLRGAHPLVAQLAAVTRDHDVVLPGPPQLPDAATGVTTETILVLARGQGNLPSVRLATLTASEGTWAKLAVTDVSPNPSSGTLTDLSSIGSGPYTLALAAGRHFGTWLSGTYSFGYDAESRVCFGWIATAEAADTVDEMDFAVDSGEAHWRLVDGRPASPAQPGAVLDESVDDLDVALDDMDPDRLVGAYRGEAGAAFAVRVFFRTARNGETLSAQPWRLYEGPVTVLHDQLQWKVELFRDDAADTVEVTGFRARRFL